MVRGGKKFRSTRASTMKGLVKKVVMTAFVVVNIFGIAFAPAQPAFAASFTFTQASWAVSADTSATATHDDQNQQAQQNVTSFYSTSSSYLTTGENLTIATSTGSFAQSDWATVNASDSRTDTEEEAGPGAWTKASTTDSQIDYTTTSGSLQLDVTENTLTHTSSSDFSGSHSSTAVSGSGDSASVVFSGTTATPIVRGKLELAPINGGGSSYSAIDAVDANTIYVAQQKANNPYYYITVHKTVDGGASWTNTDARSGNVLSNYISIAAVDTNNVYVSSNQGGNGSGLFVTKTSNGGTTWDTTTLDTTGNVHYQTSIAGVGSNVFVSYYDDSTQDLKFAKSEDSGSTWATSTVDSTGSVGRYSSIKTVSDSTPGDGPTVYISYYDTTNTALKLAKSTNGGASWTLSTPDSTTGDTGSWSSLQVTGENSLAIAYYRYYSPDPYTAYYHIRVITSSNGGASWSTAYTAASTDWAERPQFISFATPDLTNFFISYNAYTGEDLMYVSSSNGGSSWSSVATIDSTGLVGRYSSIDAVDANTAFIAYGDASSNRVKVASSGNTTTLGTYTSGSINLGAPVEITTLALTKTASGTAVSSAGLNTYNQLGDGTTTGASTAVAVQGLTNVVSVAASDSTYAYSLALLADGTVKAWGYNGNGQLGDGSTTQRSTPVTVSGISTAVAIAAGVNHSIALLADGTIKAWGYNGNGRLGDGSTTDRSTPVTVSGISTAVAIAAGGGHSLAVLADGTIKAWGYNGYGQLGDGSTTQRTTPVTVSGITNAVSVSASRETSIGAQSHSLAVLSDGTIKAWGYNGQGQLGDSSTTQRTTPVTVSGISTAVAVSAGGSAGYSSGGGHSLAILADGTAKAWGHNASEQLGDGTTTARTTPVAVSGLTDLVAVSAGGHYSSGGSSYVHSLALKSDGTAWAWGANNFSGPFANGGTTSSNTPVQSTVSNVTAIAAGAQFSLFVTGGSLAQIAANTDNSTWTYKGVPIQAGRASSGGLSELLGSSNQYVKYKLNLATKSATATPSVDALALTYRGYPTSAAYSLVSSPFNTENSSIGISSVSWTGATTSSATLKFQVRTASSLAGLYSASWCGPTDCSGTDYFVNANNGGSIANTALTDGSNDQWFQYKAILQTSSAGETPVLNSVTVNYAITLDSVNGYTLISSPYNSGNSGNAIGDVRMSVADLPSGTAAKIQVRTASSQGGLSSATWCGTDCTGSTYFAASEGTNTFSLIPGALTDGVDDQWYQYRITLIPSTDNADAPYVASAGVTYAVNTAPTVTNVTATTAATTQGATATDAGKVTVTYSLTDDALETSDTYEAYLFYDVGVTLSSDNTTTLTVSDTSKMPSSGYVQIGTEVIKYTSASNGTVAGLTRGSSDTSWPGTSTRHTKAYTVAQNTVVWIKASDAAITADENDYDDAVIEESGKTIVWDPASESQFANYSNYTAKVRVLVHDSNLANQLSSQSGSSTDSSATVIIDNLAPTFAFTFDAGVAGSTDSATVSISTSGPDATSTAEYMIADDAATHSSPTSTAWTSFTTPGSRTWTFDSDFEAKTLNVQVRDPYGNAAATSTSSTLAPLSANAFVVADVSKVSASYWREFVGWETSTSSDFAAYKLDHAVSTDGVTYSAYATTTTPIEAIAQNYFVHSDLTTTSIYRYRIGITGDNGNTSIRSSAYLAAKPDGTRNYDEGGGGDDITAPTVTNVAEVAGSLKATSVSIMFNATDGSSSITNATIYYATQADFTTNVNAGETDRDRYTLKIGNPSYITVADSTPAEHTVALTNLIKNTAYRYAVESCDIIGNCQFEDNSDAGYTFTTQNGPAIVSGTVQVTPSYNSASITWKTDLPSDSNVFYATSGLSALVNPITVGSNTQVTTADGDGRYVHTVTVPNLSYSSTYYYKVRSTDQNSASDSYTQYDESVIGSFTTTTQTPPTITAAPSCSATNSTITASWTTDQLSTTEVSVLSADVSANYFSAVAGAQVAQYPTGTIDSASRANADYVISHSNTFSGLSQSTNYYLKVRSLNPSGGEVSNTLTCTTSATEVIVSRPAVIQDVTPPIINTLVVKDITASAVTITWATDEPADSIVKHGLTLNYGMISGTEELGTEHEVTLGGLKPKTKYNFKVTSADGRGNRSYAGDQTVTTLSIEEEAAVTKKNLETLKQELEAVESQGTAQEKTESLEEAVRRFKAILKTVSSEVSLQDLEDLTTEISDTITDITQELIPPAIIGGVPQVNVESNSATIVWRTNKPSGSIIALVSQDGYDATTADPYTLQVGQPQEEVTQHTVTVPNLEPSTVYHFQIRSQAKVGPEGKSRDFVFETQPELPQILDYSFKRITENSITVAWKTNTLSNSQVHYTPFDGTALLEKNSKTQGTPEFVKDHEVTVSNLAANTNFLIEIASADVTGVSASKVIGTIHTTVDEQTPTISKVRSEATIFPGKTERTQTIIYWETDEPSTSQVFWKEGVGAGELAQSSRLDKEYTTSHVAVITSFTPGAVYRFQVASVDPSGNASRSTDYTILTPKKGETVIDLIITNFQDIFGFLKKL